MTTSPATIPSVPFGKTANGTPARLWRLANAHGMTAEVTDLGACLVSLRVPDGTGSFADVVLGYDGARAYGVNAPNFGAVVGRHANRIGGARFELGGATYELAANERGNSLHSGPDMWFHRTWEVVSAQQLQDPVASVADDAKPFGSVAASIELRLASPDGDQGFPGNLDVHVTYELTEDDQLRISYAADADAPTIVNLTNHSYFNLNGHASGSVLGHTLQIDANRYTVCDETLVPTGELADVEGTPLDLREAKPLLQGVTSDFPAIVGARGFDHNFELAGYAPQDGFVGTLRRVATLTSDVTGISMDVLTDTPGMQVYSANFIDGEVGKGGHAYRDHDAVCLETQFYPDAIHHADFAQPVFGPDNPYRSRTTYAFRHA